MLTGTILIFVLLAVFGGVIAGLGGPGGFPVILGLQSLTDLNAAIQAGTTSTIFTAATITATALYAYSGDIRKDLIYYMAVPTIFGTPTGVYLNQFLNKGILGNIIGLLTVILGSILVYRETNDIKPVIEIQTENNRGKIILAALGFGVGVIGGLTGIGGPAITIPLLIALGIPVLEAIGAGLVQGVLVTSSSAINYATSGDYSPEFTVMIGIPYVVSQLIGWYIAQNTEAKKLKILVSLFLIPAGLYLLIF